MAPSSPRTPATPVGHRGRTSRLRDLPADVTGVVAHRVLLIGKTYQPVNAPTIWPPPQTYAQMRRIATQTLPGVRYRRHLLWRYSLIWAKPASPATAR
jgi:hypothetical protein